MKQDLGLAGRLAHAFLNSKLTPLFIAASLALGIFAVAIIPREEEPQILVPMLDITTAMPGASPAEVEERVTLPIENLVHQISGVEYVYSTSSPGQSLVIVRFLVGTPQEDALIKVYSKLYSNFDRMPPGVSQPLIKARSIDDVPILRTDLRCVRNNDHRRSSAHHARCTQHRKVERLRPVALGHCRASSGRKFQRAGRKLRCKQRGDPGGRRQPLRQPRGFGIGGSGSCQRAPNLPA
jgi:hypothetical protein